MHLKGLNSQQKEAVLHKEGPLMIIAGAGAGKTKTITHRILNLIKSGVAPQNILAVTFTNKAAKEMKDRVKDLIDKDEEINFPISTNAYPYVATFHALGVKILKENARFLNTTRYFKIFDRNDSLRAVKDSIKKVDLDDEKLAFIEDFTGSLEQAIESILKSKTDRVNKKLFDKINVRKKLNLQLIPYFISSHPASELEDMANLAAETKDMGFKLEQVQGFTPTPMTVATVIYYSGYHPYTLKKMNTPKTKQEKEDQHRFFFWYKPENQKWIRNTLKKVGRLDLVERLLPKEDEQITTGFKNGGVKHKSKKKEFVSVLPKKETAKNSRGKKSATEKKYKKKRRR